MFNSKLFLFIFFLLFGEVSETTLVTEKDTVCQDWYLNFPTKSHCVEYYKHHGNTKPRTTTSTVATTTTTTTSQKSSSTVTSTWTLPDFETTVSPPAFTTVTKISTTLQTSTMTSAATNSAQNKTPWFLSLWAVVIYR